MKTELNLLFATTPKRRPAPAWRLALGLVVLAGLFRGAPPDLCAQSSGSEEYTFLTLAGPAESGPDAIDGPGSVARFNTPKGVAVDGTGNVYVADSGNETIRKISPAGMVTTLAGLARESGSTDGTGSAARFKSPWGIAVDSAGNVYVADSGNETIRKISPAGTVTTLAGVAGRGGCADGTGSAARFSQPRDIAVDGADNLYVADGWGNEGCGIAIRKITPAGVVTTLAVRAGDSPFHFDYIDGVAVDGVGNLYVAEAPSYTGGGCVIWKIGPGGEVAALAGLQGHQGTADGTGSEARFWGPTGVAVDRAGNVYVTEYSSVIRKISPAGVVTTMAGWAFEGAGVDGTGSEARFVNPSGIATDSAGNMYVADAGTIRQMTPGGVVTTLAGPAWPTGSVDGTGSAARFGGPEGIAVDSGGNVYVADWSSTIRKISPGGVVTTIAGGAGECFADGAGRDARFCQPTGVAADGAGNIYVADWGNNVIRKISPQGTVTTLAGNTSITDQSGRPASGYADGPGNVARFNWPRGIAVDRAGNVFVAEQNNHTIRKITPAGVVTTLAGNALIKNQNGDPKGGYADGTGAAARFNTPEGVAVDGAGDVYVADSGNQMIRKITPEGVVTTIAGTSLDSDGDGWPDGGYADGTGSAARFNGPYGVAVDRGGNVYVTDNGMLRKVNPTGVVTTLAGQPGSTGSADGTGSAARFNELGGVAVDSAGNLYVADFVNNTIRIGTTNTCPDAPTIDLAVGPVGQVRQLDTSPQTAVAWQWSIIRRPANSVALISVANTRNPTFTPDVADLFVFRLEATNAAGAICIRALAFTATPTPPRIVAASLVWTNGQFSFTVQSQAGSAVEIQASTNLVDWTSLATLTNETGTLPFTDTDNTYTRRFYRVRVP
jgi:hypothetical protein